MTDIINKLITLQNQIQSDKHKLVKLEVQYEQTLKSLKDTYGLTPEEVESELKRIDLELQALGESKVSLEELIETLLAEVEGNE